jgi:hypothetical protein
MVYTLRFFSSKCSMFHNSNLFGSCIIHILYTECAKIKKNNSGAKRLKELVMADETQGLVPLTCTTARPRKTPEPVDPRNNSESS